MSEPPAYRLMRTLAMGLLRLFSRVNISGLENIPMEGPVVIASNHLHVFDVLVAAAVIPRRQTALVADNWRLTPAGFVLKLGANAIWVARGEADRDALAQALAVLKAGNALTVSPEGTRSRTGGLLQGKNGPAYLASRGEAAIVPMVAWGQERALGDLAHLRRPRVHVRFAPPIYVPGAAARARSADLTACTDELMMTMARLLPPDYRGVYRERVAAEESIPAIE